MTDPAPPPPSGAPGQPPNNYLVWSILTTIFCCIPLGIASIVFSAQVNGKWQAGDVAGANDSADKAKKFAIWGAIIGGVINLLVVVFYVVVVIAAVESGSSSSF